MKSILLLITVFILSACTVTQPHVQEYRVFTQESAGTFDAKSCKQKSLKVSQAFSSNSLMSQTMKYAKDDYAEYSFSESAWSRSPNRAITDEIIKSLRTSKLFASVQSYKSRSSSDLILESNIEEFVQHFSADEKSSYVKVVITMSLVDVNSGLVMDTTTISKRLDVKEMSAEGGVKALNSALSMLLGETLEWLNGVCK